MLTALVALIACHHPAGLYQDWRAEALLTPGEVRVLPVVETWEHTPPRLDSYVGAVELPEPRAALRRERTEQLADIPPAITQALPGEVGVALGSAGPAHFRPGRYPLGARERIEGALRRDDAELDVVLEAVARGMPGEAALITWVSHLEGEPLTAEGFPGDIIETAVGPVMVDHSDEPYRVHATVGVALVSTTGELVLRYDDNFEAVLSGRDDPDRVGRTVARALADEVDELWPVDPSLYRVAHR